MALNEMIAQGAQFKMPDPLEQYGRIAQIQQAQNQNALAQYQISSAQRADETNTNFLGALRAAGNDPMKIQQAYINAGKGKEASEYATSLLTQQKARGDVQEQLRKDFTFRLQDLSNNPSDANVTANAEDIAADANYPAAFKTTAARKFAELLAMPVEDRAKLLSMSGMSGAERATARRPIATSGTVFDVNGNVIGQAPEPGFSLSPGQTRYPRGYVGTGVISAPAAAPAAVKPPEKIDIMTRLGYPLTPAGDEAYEAAKRAKPTVAAPSGDISTMTDLGIPITPEGYKYFQELKTKPSVVAPEARTTEEKNAELIALGAGPKGSPEFNAALRVEVARMTAKPPAAVKAEPTTNEMTNARAIALKAGPEGSDAFNAVFFPEMSRMTAKPITAPESTTPDIKNATALALLKGERGSAAFNKEFVKQMEKSTAKSGGGEGGGGAGGAAGTGTVEVVDPKDRTKTIIVTKARAVAEGLTPAKAIEGLTPQMRQKLEASYPQATSSLRGHQNKTALFIKDVKALRDSPGLDSVTGFAAGRAPGLTDAGRATVALYDKVVAKGGFQSLQDMRDMSKTGGALGNVSDRENQQLKASFAAIDRKQNANDVRTALDDLIKELEGGLGRLQDAYDLTYEYKRGTAAPAAGGVDANNPLLRGK
jgi:hypothetical protein